MPAFPTFLRLAAALLAAATVGLQPARPDEPAIPRFIDTREQLPRPDLSGLERLRFLTTVDFAPFNFLDEAGRLSGFHVDLARAICDELDLLDRCEIQGLPFAELEEALFAGSGEAIIAGMAIDAENRARFAFSRSYLQFPARFVSRRDATLDDALAAGLAGRRVGVMARSNHEIALRTHFPEARPVTYSRADWLLRDLKDGKLDAGFGDGMRLSFWLAGAESGGCCQFLGGPYLLPDLFGHGLAIASRPDDPALAAGFDYALREIHAKGIFAELYLRYFPVSFF